MAFLIDSKERHAKIIASKCIHKHNHLTNSPLLYCSSSQFLKVQMEKQSYVNISTLPLTMSTL